MIKHKSLFVRALNKTHKVPGLKKASSLALGTRFKLINQGLLGQRVSIRSQSNRQYNGVLRGFTQGWQVVSGTAKSMIIVDEKRAAQLRRLGQDLHPIPIVLIETQKGNIERFNAARIVEMNLVSK